jgi:hypothetical protein
MAIIQPDPVLEVPMAALAGKVVSRSDILREQVIGQTAFDTAPAHATSTSVALQYLRQN